MAILKRVRRGAPYIERTFNDQNSSMTGRSGLLFCGPIKYIDSSHVDIPAYAFLQDGVVVINEDGHLNVVVPVDPEEVLFVVVGSPDITEGSGVVMAVTSDLGDINSSVVVIATRYNGVWTFPPKVSIDGVASDVRAINGLEGSGVLEGLKARMLVTFGNDFVDEVDIRSGKALNARGELLDARVRDVPLGSGPDDHARAPVFFVDAFWPRNDYFVARTPDRFPGPNSGAIAVRGGTIARIGAPIKPVFTLDALATVISRPAFAFSGNTVNTDCFHAWTNGTNLLYATTRFTTTGEAIISSGSIAVGAAFPFTGERDVFVLPRPSMGDFLVFYVETVVGPQTKLLKVVAVTAAGVIVDGPVLLTTGALFKETHEPRAAMDVEGHVHLVAQSDDTLGHAQIFYWRLDVSTGALFGTMLGGTPRFAAGIDDLDLDADPSIALDRRGNIFIAYTTSVGPTSEVALVRMDRLGNQLQPPEIISTWAVSNIFFPGSTQAYTQEVPVSRGAIPRVVVTPQDELYVVFVGGKPPTPTVLDHLYLYNPAFQARIGNGIGGNRGKAIDLFAFPALGLTWDKLELISDPLGTLHLIAMTSASTVAIHRRYDTVIAPAKVLAPSQLEDFPVTHRTGSIYAAMMPTGSIKLTGHVTGGIATTQSVAAGTTGFFTPHPTDVFLAGWSIPRNGDPNPTQPASSSGVHVHRSRPVRHKTPILVGNDGDYIGFDSLNQAIDASRGTGQQIRLQPGVHKLFGGTAGGIFGGVDIVGAPGAIIQLDTENVANLIAFAGLGNIGVTPQAGTPGVVILASTANIFPGDMLQFPSSGVAPPLPPAVAYYHIVEVLDDTRVRLYPDTAIGPGTGTHLSAGVRIRGCRLIARNLTGAALPVILLTDLWNPELDRFEVEGAVITVTRSRGALVREVNISAGGLFVGFSDRVVIKDVTTRGAPPSLEAGIQLFDCRRITAHGNRSTDNGALPDYKVTGCADLQGWSDNIDSGKSNAIVSDDPGQLVSADVVLRARNSVITKDLVAQRINAGIYDARLAALAMEIDTLKNQNTLTLAFGEIVYFDDASALI